MMEYGRQRVSGWRLVVALGGVFVFLYLVRHILLPFVIAAALAYIMNPAVRWLQRRYNLRRWLAALPVYLAFVGVLVAVGWPFTTTLAREFADVVTNLPQMLRNLITQMMGPGEFHILGATYDADTLTEHIIAGLQQWVGHPEDLFQVIAGGSLFVFGLTLTFVLLLFFMISAPRLGQGLLWLVPPEHRAYVHTLAVKIHPILLRYFVGLAAILIYTTVLTWIVLGPVLGLPNPLLIAVCVGLLELIPVIGPAGSVVLIGITALQQQSVEVVIALAIFVFIERISIDQIVGPIVLGHAALLHPVVIIFAFLAGGLLFGVVGLVLAVPVALALKVVLNEYYAEPIRDDG
jgi:predicted PurR-regulated permease PerM